MLSKKLLKLIIIYGEIKTEEDFITFYNEAEEIWDRDNGFVDLRIKLYDRFSCEIYANINNKDYEEDYVEITKNQTIRFFDGDYEYDSFEKMIYRNYEFDDYYDIMNNLIKFLEKEI